MGFTSNKKELKHRVEAKKKEFQAEIERLKADSSQSARDVQGGLEDKLGQIQAVLKDGWDNLTEEAASKLNGLLSDD